jgi:hypothetical protein
LSPISPDDALKVTRKGRGNAIPYPWDADFVTPPLASVLRGTTGTGSGRKRAVAPLAQKPRGGEKGSWRAKQRGIASGSISTSIPGKQISHIDREREEAEAFHTLSLRPDQKQIPPTTHKQNNTISNSQTVPPDISLALPGAQVRRPDEGARVKERARACRRCVERESRLRSG